MVEILSYLPVKNSFKITPTSGTARINHYGDSFLTLMEIAG